MKLLTHPVYVKSGATTPRNYDARRITAADKARLFAHKYDQYSIRTITDVLSEIKIARALITAKK